MIDFDIENLCYGCRACYEKCPTKAIEMMEGASGFLVPIINSDKCIHCNLCDDVCLRKHSNTIAADQVKYYKGYSVNPMEREISTSGGIFGEVADIVLDMGGYVCGCIFNSDLHAVHILSNDKEVVKKMRGSKYVQSDLNNCFAEIKKIINDNVVLFSGTPCQVAAAKRIIKNKNMITIAVVCAGAPSPMVWKKYIHALERKYNSKINNVNFRYKDKLGWRYPVIKYDFPDGKSRKTLSYLYDIYVMAFIQGLINRPACNSCQYKANDSAADLVIGDFWGADNVDLKDSCNKGYSIIAINTPVGKDYIKKAVNIRSKMITLQEINKCNDMFTKSLNKNYSMEPFFDKLKNNMDVIKCLKDFTEYNKYKRMIREIAYKLGVLKIYFKLRGKL